MVTIAHIVRKVMEDKPFIQECLLKSLINLGALAEYLKPSIEKELGKKVKLLTISMALRRHISTIKKSPLAKIKIDKNTDLTCKSNLVELTIKKSQTLTKKINTFSKKINREKGDILSINQGTQNISLLTNTRKLDSLKKVLCGEKIITQLKEVGAVFISIPSNYRSTPGFFYLLTKELAFNNISILSTSNIETEVLFVFKDNDVAKAYNVLYKLITKKQNN